MLVERTNNDQIVITLSSSIDKFGLQRLIDYMKYLEANAKRKTRTEDLDSGTDEEPADTLRSKISDFYFSVLKNLNSDSKLDLIAQLSQSLEQDSQPKPDTLKSLFGAYQTDETAEQIIEGIRSSRISNRNTEPL